jgi:very-short-patch-repair endonuclease
MLKCKYCSNDRKNENSLRNHERLCKDNPSRQSTYVESHQTELTQSRIDAGYSNQFTKAKQLGLPAPIVTNETRNKLSIKTTKNNLSRDASVHKKISESMKTAHKEGRAWNIGKSRWNNEPSWPEQFFIQVINNEFNDKNYTREHPIGVYSIDFAWVEKKLAIEIDGDQHQRFESYRERDARKDKLLADNGWKILRIVWKDMYKDTKKHIKMAKEFVEG